MCDECVIKEFPEEKPIRIDDPQPDWPDIDKDPPARDPPADPRDQIRCKG